MTKARLLQCIIRTAAMAHWRHHRARIALPANDADEQFETSHDDGIPHV